MSEHSFEEQYLNILQNIEAAILRVHRDLPDLVDLQVDAAMEALIRTYQTEEATSRLVLPRSVSAKTVFDAVRKVTEWRLGRQGFENDERREVFIETPVSTSEIIQCLKRIRKSIQTWNKSNGSQGYLNYIGMFIK